jgi:N-acetylneuraminic acid mutarotase
MRQLLSLSAALALGSFALASCGDETTQPNTAADEPAVIPQLAGASNTWITRAAPLVSRFLLFTATVPNAAGQSVVYAIGGKPNENYSLRRVDAYNVATNTWRRKADMPTALRDQTGSSMNGKIYVAGGISTPNLPTAFLYVYDPVTNTWTRKRDMPTRVAGGASGVIHGKLYVLASGFFFRYNPATNSWVRLPAPAGLYNAGAVLFDKFYAVGDAWKGWDKLVVYDPATNQWTTKAPPPPLGFYFGDAVAVGGKMYVIGLQALNPEETGSYVRNVTWVYSPGSNTWSERTPGPEAPYTATKVFLNGRPRIEAIYGGLNLQYIP